ncbi:uncharacterized protein LOC110868644 isoform X2 [Helianthus annuus]|uniref:uncharacterized protein LOC110868644 isoform X2 n=1 Tax=Helianthus annuus TaxID=4232 RepID=UPI001652F711|nr:uncharacterized protein LOC110868644 isoform X2 [Helianthus annuus]
MMFFSVLRTRYAQDVKTGKITVVILANDSHVSSERSSYLPSERKRAILVNPWNITDVASSTHHNFMHVITHTCQKWAETFLRINRLTLICYVHYTPWLMSHSLHL